MRLGAEQGVSLATLTSMRVGGEAALALCPKDEQTLIEALRLCGEAGLPLMVLGNGTNVIASDKGYEGLIICLNKPWFAPIYRGRRVRVSAGMPLSAFILDNLAHGLRGLERLYGIPGSVGGACAMNAGAYGGEIADCLRSVRALERGEPLELAVQREDMGYRKSPFSFPNRIVLEAEFELEPDDGSAEALLQDCAKRRRDKQPLEFPSAGSTFKRPEGHFAGALIEQCGLKGRRIGGASVSNKHAGFIINDRNATAEDVERLIELVRSTVLDKTGVLLECEVRRI